MNDAAIVAAMIQLLSDPDDRVQAGAASVLKRSTVDSAHSALQKYELTVRVARIAKLDYVVGRNFVSKGVYQNDVGTHTVGYFDPLRAVFRRFDQQGIPITSDGGGATALVWPPDCSSIEEAVSFSQKASTLAQALGTYPSELSVIYMMSNPLGDINRLLRQLDEVGDGVVDEFIYKNSVRPFFERYSPGPRTVMIDDVVKEVKLNARFNFLCSEVVRAPGVEDVGTARLKQRASEIVSSLKAKH